MNPEPRDWPLLWTVALVMGALWLACVVFAVVTA